MDTIYTCWHFAHLTLRDGTPLPAVGETLEHVGPIVPCESGYHGSVKAIDALVYARGAYVARIEIWGETMEHGDPPDKVVGRYRRCITPYVDVTRLLRRFARECDLSVAYLWNCPDIVREHLESGSDEIRDGAWAAAWDEARAAASAAARDLASTAASTAARDAARAAYRAAALAASWDAAWEAARAASWDEAWDVAWDVAWDSIRSEQNDRLTKLLEGSK